MSESSQYEPQGSSQLSSFASSSNMEYPLSSEERQLMCTSLLGSILVNFGDSVSIQARHLLESLLGSETWSFCCQQFSLLLDHWDNLGRKERDAVVLITSKVLLSDCVDERTAEEVLLKLIRRVICFRGLVEPDCPDRNMMNTWQLIVEYVTKKFPKNRVEFMNTCSQTIFYISLKTVYVATRRAKTVTENWEKVLSCAERVISLFQTADIRGIGYCFYQILEMLKDSIPDYSSQKRVDGHVEHFWNRIHEFSLTPSPLSVIIGSIPFEIEKQLQQLFMKPLKSVTELETFLAEVSNEGVTILDLIRCFMHQPYLKQQVFQSKAIWIGLVEHSVRSLGIDPTSKTLVEPLIVATYSQDSSAIAKHILYEVLLALFKERYELLRAVLANLLKICEKNAVFSYRLHECLHFDMQNDSRVKDVFLSLCGNFKIAQLCKQLGILELESSSIIDLTESDDEQRNKATSAISDSPLKKDAVQSKSIKRKQQVTVQEEPVSLKKQKVVENGESASLKISATPAREEVKLSSEEKRVTLEAEKKQQQVMSDQSKSLEHEGVAAPEGNKDIAVVQMGNESTRTTEITENKASAEFDFAVLERNAETEKEQRNESVTEASIPGNVPVSDNMDSESTASSCSYSTAIGIEGSTHIETNEGIIQNQLNAQEQVISSTSLEERGISRDKEMKNFIEDCRKYLYASGAESVSYMQRIINKYSKKSYLFAFIQQKLAQFALENFEDSGTVVRLKGMNEHLYKHFIRERAHRVSSFLSLSAEFLYIVRQQYVDAFQEILSVSRNSVMVNLISQGHSGFVKLQNLYQLLCLEEDEIHSEEATASTLVHFNEDVRILSFSCYRDDALGFLLDIASIFPDFILDNLEYFDLLTLVMNKDNMKRALELVKNGTIQMLSFQPGKMRIFCEIIKCSFEWKSHEKQTFLWKLLLKDISNRNPSEQTELCHKFLLLLRTELSFLSLNWSRALLEVFSDWVILQIPNQGILFALFELGEPFADMVSDIICAWLVRYNSREELTQLLLNGFCSIVIRNLGNQVFLSRVRPVVQACYKRLSFFQFLNTERGKPLKDCCQQIFQKGEEIHEAAQ